MQFSSKSRSFHFVTFFEDSLLSASKLVFQRQVRYATNKSTRTRLPRATGEDGPIAAVGSGFLEAGDKQCKRRPRMFDFLIVLHKWDTKKMQEVREALTKKLPRRRPEFIDMDRKLVHFVNTALLGTDQQIIGFLDAISMALQRIEPHFQAIGAEEGTSEEKVEETAEENMPLFGEQNEIFIGHDHSYF
uniref:Uncharacterized protein n=1 Tax=Globodera rostochiensis TaxID=31243 RepID=A0A914H5G2_GLORO